MRKINPKKEPKVKISSRKALKVPTKSRKTRGRRRKSLENPTNSGIEYELVIRFETMNIL